VLGIGAASLLVGLIAHAIVQSYFPQDDIPWESVVWAMPLGASVVLFGYNIRAVWPALASAGGVITSTALMLLLANNYYHYYPTLDAALSHTGDAAELADVTMGARNFAQTVFEQYYTPPAHQQTQGTLTPLNIPASKPFSPQQGRLYLPPALQNNNTIKLPVIVLLAGFPGSPLDWEQHGIKDVMDQFAHKHKGLAPIVAVVDFGGVKGVDTECVDSKLGAVETYLARDVPNYLKSHYQASQSSSDWTIAGYSAGGTCSTLIALRNPSTYQNFMNISGDTYPSLETPAETLGTLFNGSVKAQNEHTPDLLLKKGNELYKTMNAWYFMGQQDNAAMIQHVANQAVLAAAAGVTVKHVVVAGHHGFLVWKEGFVEGLPWIMNRIGLTVGEK
jgi:S-formylglutathione hydrolase FrmB